MVVWVAYRTKRLGLAEQRWQSERRVSQQVERQAEPEPQLFRERLERELSVPGRPREDYFFSCCFHPPIILPI